VYARPSGFANLTVWTPNHGSVALDRPTYYLRAAATPTVGRWHLGGGVQWWWGTSGTIGRATEALAFDVQAHGSAGRVPLGIYLSYARAPGSPPHAAAADSNFFNALPYAQWAVAGAAEVGVIPRRLTVGLAYRDARTGADQLFVATAASPFPTFPAISIYPPPSGYFVNRDVDRAFTMSSTLLLAQNLELHVSHTLFSGNAWAGRRDDEKFSMTLFAAF
jgi:hypothetical protein